MFRYLSLIFSVLLPSIEGTLYSMSRPPPLGHGLNIAPEKSGAELMPGATQGPGRVSFQNNTACTPPALNNSTWMQLGIDNYLSSFPNGTSLDLQQFATQVGASNFICGIGETCQAGQLCYPVQSPGWEILFAAQEWNNFQNKFYQATTSAIESVTAIASSLVADLYDPKDHGSLWKFLSNMDGSDGLIYALLASLVVTTLDFILFPFAIISLLVVLPTLGIVSGVSAMMALKAQSRGNTVMEQFSIYAYHLDRWLKKAQKSISDDTNRVVYSGVSSPQGISSVLKNGTFFHARPSVDEVELASNLRNTTTVRILTDILRSQNAFVTIESDKCSYRGAYETSKDDDLLSYCSPNGTLFNIIRARQKKVHTHWVNADLVSKKYGITVEYLVNQSYFCQLNHGSANFDPYRAGIFPANSSAECLSNLPVCDFRDPDIAKGKNEKNVLYACRNIGRLPI